MYQKRVRHVLSAAAPEKPGGTDEAMWRLFTAIGDFWQLDADDERYRLRLRAFMTNRINLNPAYRGFYSLAHRVIDKLLADHGSPKGYEVLFTNKAQRAPNAPPETELEFVQVYVANEFVALRVALGGFKAFGGVNYCGFFGGANIPDQPVPYRPMRDDP